MFAKVAVLSFLVPSGIWSSKGSYKNEVEKKRVFEKASVHLAVHLQIHFHLCNYMYLYHVFVIVQIWNFARPKALTLCILETP